MFVIFKNKHGHGSFACPIVINIEKGSGPYFRPIPCDILIEPSLARIECLIVENDAKLGLWSSNLTWKFSGLTNKLC